MTTSLSTIEFRGTRRVRLTFTGSLASGAFTSTALYGIESVDGAGPSPTNVVAVFAVANAPASVELQIDEDLASGGLYEIECTNVPCADASLFTGTLEARVALALTTPVNVEPETNDLDLLLYGRDLLFDGDDFVEDATGDLGTIDGRDNWEEAMGRRFESEGLPWDDTYGPKAEEYVDAPERMATPFAGALLAQARADNRTAQASVDIVQPDDTGDWEFEVTLVGVDGLDPATITVPNPTNSS